MTSPFRGTTLHVLAVAALLLLVGVAASFQWPQDITGAVTKDVRCVVPALGMKISGNAVFCTGEYTFADGVEVDGRGITLDCNGAVLRGEGRGTGVTIRGENIVIKDCIIERFLYGVSVEGSENRIENLEMRENFYGIYLSSGKSNSVYNNRFRGNQQDLVGQGDNAVWGNMFS